METHGRQGFGPDVDVESCAYIHPTTQLYGKIEASKDSSFWPYSVVRSEMNSVKIGAMTNIQDFVMIHIGTKQGTTIGKYCSITHRVTLHGCTIGDYCLVGINSTIMDGCQIGNNCVIAGHTFLKENTIIPDNSIVMGTPGKVVKTKNNKMKNKINALFYYKNALAYQKGMHRSWSKENMFQDIVKTGKKLLEANP